LFKWSTAATTLAIPFDHYEIEIATDSGFSDKVHHHNITNRTSPQDGDAVLNNGTTYYWHVRAVSTTGDTSAWSAVRSVRIKYAGATLNLPAAASTVASLKPTFAWNAVDGATSYTIQVSKSTAFGTFVVNKASILPTYIQATNLTAATTYYWRVRVNGAYGPGDWSAVSSFTTP
jgi:hypothetical protein